MRNLLARVAGLALVLSLALGEAGAQTSYPMVTHLYPVAVQRGKTIDVTVEAQLNIATGFKAASFGKVHRVLVEGAGVTAEVPAKIDPKQPARSLPMKVTVAADAPLGVREFRLATSLGVSSIGQILIVDDPVVMEAGDNNTREKANPAPVPSVVCGKIEAAEDVDFFKFKAEAGQTLTFEVHCARLQDKIHDLQKHADPMLTLYDAEGRELAANDDYYFADPMLGYTFSRSGDYYIQVRDSKYDGDPRWVYALAISNKPYAAHVFPMAGNPGQMVEVEAVGSLGKPLPRVQLKAPAEPGVHRVQLDLADGKTNPTTFIVSSLPQVAEQEPNDSPETANRITIPSGINGRIGTRRDLDHFIFQGTKGKAIRFEVKARRFGTELNSTLDSFIDVMTPKGQMLVSNDDIVGSNVKDSGVLFTPMADGDYVVRIRDLHSRGGPSFVYYLEADWAVPDFSVRCDGDKAMIGPGSSTAWYVKLDRRNGFTGPVKIEVKGLPPAVTVSPLTIPSTMSEGVIVLTAAAGAGLDVANVQMVDTGYHKTADGKEETLVRPVQVWQEIYSPGGGRARFEVGMQTVGITEQSDILKVEVTPQKIVLKPGEEVKIAVKIQRRPDYDKAVSLNVMLAHLGQVFGNPLPPGVTVDGGKSKTLLGAGNEGHIVLKAAPNAAPVEEVPISVLAHVSVNFVVKVSYSSAPILVTIQPK